MGYHVIILYYNTDSIDIIPSKITTHKNNNTIILFFVIRIHILIAILSLWVYYFSF